MDVGKVKGKEPVPHLGRRKAVKRVNAEAHTMAKLSGVEIFGVGTWNYMKFVAEDLEEIVKNTNQLSQKHKIPLKLGHSEKQILAGQTDGDPALGYAQNFAVKEDKITADFENMPDILFESIEKERFTSVSVEMNHEANFGWYITAIALLGADIPAVKSIQDLQAYLTEIIPAMETSKTQQMLTFSEPKLEKTQIERKEMSDSTAAQDAIVKENEALKKRLGELEVSLKDRDQKFSEAEKQLQTFAQEAIEHKFAQQKEAILAGYREDSKAGKLPPAMLLEIEKHLDGQKANFTDTAELHLSADLARKVAVAYTDAMKPGETAANADESGKGSTLTPDQLLENEIAKVRAQTNATYSEAFELVIASNQKLFADYHRWTADIAEGRA